jgi:hypothetical protein
MKNLSGLKGGSGTSYSSGSSNFSSTHPTSSRPFFPPTEIGDSDGEFAEEESFPIFSRGVPQKASAMTIKCSDRNIKGCELIKIAHEIVREKYDYLLKIINGEFKNGFEYYGMLPDTRELKCPTLFKLPHSPIHVNSGSKYSYTLKFPAEINAQSGKVVISVNNLTDWLISLGGWKQMQPRTEIPEYGLSEDYTEYFFSGEGKKRFAGVWVHASSMIFPITEELRIHLPENFAIGQHKVTTANKREGGVWTTTIKTDLSYAQIISAIDYIKYTYRINDSTLAKMQLECLGGKNIITLGKIDQGTDYLFWELIDQPIETQIQIRDFLNYLTALMFGVEASGLNSSLITSLMTLGLIKKGNLTYKNAFLQNNDGGAYPFATFGDNRGTFSARTPIIDGYETSMKKYREDSSKSPVAVKEAIMIKQWLKHNNLISRSIAYEDQIINIKEAITKLLEECLIYNWGDDYLESELACISNSIGGM